MNQDVFSPHIEKVARLVWGDPNAHVSTKTELRWGKHGARSVDIEKGVWFDNEIGQGGGVVALLEREAKVKGGAAVSWLRDHGIDIPDDRAPIPTQKRRIVAEYDYVDENGEVLFQAVRFEPKGFSQRRPARADDDAAKIRDGWVWSVKDVRQVPYRLPDLINACEGGGTVYITEGEKDADALWALGVPATCNAMGAGKWPAELSPHLKGLDVIILPDNDDAGRAHRDLVATQLTDIAATVRVLELPDLPLKGDVSNWLEVGGDAEKLHALSIDAKPWKKAPPESRFGAIQWIDLKSFQARRDWRVEDIAYDGDLMLTYGESRGGKSFLAIEMGMSIVRGVPFFGMQTRPGAVAYQAGEGGNGVVSRLQAYGIHHGVQTQDLPFILLKSQVDLYAPDGDTDAFIEELVLWQNWLGEQFAMVTIDTFSAATAGANENASEDVSRIIKNGKRIRDATGGIVNWVHHKNAGGTKARGHTSLFADADAALDVVWDEEANERTFTLKKVKDGPSGKKIGFQLQPVEIGSSDSGKPITSCVVSPVEEDDQRTGKRPERKPLTTYQKLFLSALHDALFAHGAVAPSHIGAPHNMRVVEWKHVQHRFRLVADPDAKTDTVDARCRRAGDELLGRGIIDRSNPFLWITDFGRTYR